MRMKKSQLYAISYAYTEKARKNRLAKIVEIDGDLTAFKQSKYKHPHTYLRFAKGIKYIY